MAHTRIRTFRRLATTFATAAALATAIPALSHAGDFCITTGPNTWVGKNFKIPGKGKCHPWAGFETAEYDGVTTGTACTASDGSHVRFTLTTVRIGYPVVFIDAIELPLPNLFPGTYRDNSPDIGLGTNHVVGTVGGGPCNPSDMPVP
jgi:hypothetical protein